MLKKIVAVSGKSGLYRLVSKGKNMLIIESLADKKRIPVYGRDNVISLGDVSIYTDKGEAPIREALTSIKEKENGKSASIDLSKAQADELRAYLAEAFPNFDRERVYPSDIKKLLKWYEILIANGITDFSEKKEDAADTEVKDDKDTPEAKPASSMRKEISMISTKSTKAKSTPKTSTPKKSVIGAKRGG